MTAWVAVLVAGAASFALRLAPARWAGGRALPDGVQRGLTGWFGVRGVGSLFYLAYATGAADFGDSQLLWSTVAFTIVLSVLVHGVTATPVMRRLERARGL